MDVRVCFEIGHEASIRTKKTPDGFTHDWEVFVRGIEGADIHQFVEKVVFNLHDTFPKPRRVVKEPPYSVKESGYAGFSLPIEIYLHNKYEPKKIKFNYELNLQPSGPPLYKLIKEKYTFKSPSEDFKSKLLKGGGTVVNSSNSHDNSDSRPAAEEKSHLMSKPKLSGSDSNKKHKLKCEEMPFEKLFGEIIMKPSKAPEPKILSKDSSKSNSNSSVNNKTDKDKERDKSKSKYSPNKDKDREREKLKDKGDSSRKNKEEKRSKDRNRERDHSKEKSIKKEKSPRPPSPKRSPPRTSSPKRPASPPVKNKEDKREKENKERDRKSDEKSDKKLKKDKRDKDKDHKESKHKESQKVSDYKDYKNKEVKTISREIKEKETSPPPSPIPPKDKKDKEKKDKDYKDNKLPNKDSKEIDLPEKNDKIKPDKFEDKPKHKHKKKDKDKKEKREEKEKTHKSEKKSEKTNTKYEPIKETSKDCDKTNSLFSSPRSEALDSKSKLQKHSSTVFADLDNESTNSSISSMENMFASNIEKPEEKPEVVEQKKKIENEVPLKVKKEKSKKKDKKSDKDTEKRRKRKSEIIDEAPQEKIVKDDMPQETSLSTNSEDEQSSNAKKPKVEESAEKPEEYMNILKDLQHKIMNLQDNSELQKVVQLIAETGRYEVSSCTFDFDLCLLDRSTVQQLQEFFSSPS